MALGEMTNLTLCSPILNVVLFSILKIPLSIELDGYLLEPRKVPKICRDVANHDDTVYITYISGTGHSRIKERTPSLSFSYQ